MRRAEPGNSLKELTEIVIRLARVEDKLPAVYRTDRTCGSAVC